MQSSMHLTKAHGPDGMLALFFQKFWNIIGEDVTKLCLDMLNGHSQLFDINNTHIVLILKTREPRQISQFRPISLCNVVYKILANRLRKVLPTCISTT